MNIIIYLLAVILLPFMIYINIYNGLISRRNRVEESFSGIDVQLKKRYDLLPNLVSTVKQYMGHEEKILTEITGLRSRAVNDNLSKEEVAELNKQLSEKLNTLNVVVENYPELKADKTFENLQRSLNEIESQISASRRTYNANVREYNNKIEQFPSSIIARGKGFLKYDFFTIAEMERDNVNIDNLFNK